MASYLVTGANRGIGLELVKQLSALPASQVSQVFAVSRRSSDTVDKIPSDRVVPVITPNLTSATDVNEAVEEVRGKLKGKGLDVLINNAGVLPWTKGGMGETQDLPVQDLMQTMETNVGIALAMTSGFLPLLKEGDGKKIFNISTTLGSLTRAKDYAWSPSHAYKISKAAFNMLSQQFAIDLGPKGFTVVLISPGWLKTDAGSQAADLEVNVGVKAVLDVMFSSGPEQNGKFLNIHVPGWEKVDGPNWYDGKEVPW